ncbi:hypothetical protein [Nostoc sp.]|uniref:hypothetical protein n=1 Tax=Nostoc sp. TaxID=1180 RepID=UPI002FFA9206
MVTELVLSVAVGVVTERSRTPPGKQATRSVSKSCAASRREVMQEVLGNNSYEAMR